MIIDIHTHQNHMGLDGRRRAANPRFDQPPVEASDRMLERAAEVGITHLCLLGRFWANPFEPGVRAINDNTIAMVRRHPGRVFGLCFLNPRLKPRFLAEEIDRCIAAGLHGVKHEYEMLADDPRLDVVMEKVAEHDVFILHHAWNKTVNRYPQESGSAEIAKLAARHPNTRILMAHLTGVGMQGVLDVCRHENVMVDTSGSQCFAGLVEYAVNKLGAERVVFGSDAMGRDFAPQLGRIYGARLSESQRRQILWDNAARLLKIDGSWGASHA